MAECNSTVVWVVLFDEYVAVEAVLLIFIKEGKVFPSLQPPAAFSATPSNGGLRPRSAPAIPCHSELVSESHATDTEP